MFSIHLDYNDHSDDEQYCTDDPSNDGNQEGGSV